MAEEEKTEEPTSKRRGEARSQGQVAKSVEINSTAILIAGIYAVYIYRWDLFDGLSTMMKLVFQNVNHFNPSINEMVHYSIVGVIWMAKLIGPICLILLLVGVAANYLQIGWLFTLKPITPDISKVSPIKGIKNLFSMSKVFDLVKNLAKLGIIGGVAYYTVKDFMGVFIMLVYCSPAQILEVLLSVILKLGIRIALVLLLLSIIDFIYQKHRHNKQLKMSKQEVKEERKQTEGDPQVKGRIRSLQIEMARRRMMGEVPKATVVITNPTHIAIALKYEMGVDKAPVVLAKGKRKIAEKIKEIAREYGIPIVEDKPLARAMYDVLELGSEVPQAFFTPVAEILAYVYRLKGKVA
ncbi:MAG: flagellar biosynthesis protein FlhB [Candidatus Raymondbacteria bacterium RifOxyA12_full_50_37]|uniref:Flagellar biosynthetic protein FlhB n=1 Tax=Candidatus Raymondbacteria bacterium RIFOXYD12_FULL_49_13 TaxID=1817890 RepID=A0A1F7FAR2_UNCRA|nr:MAG: flagellar biosynthesis protein FlhB [Candidatus Raymondbacteria bacterium RifOxyA12_full_50_37]OGJ92610.1 MAG: flagellar biosynthesis protein FlhB [Candidatus Raymondbacteria bacterium RIFOXYA2_FULL_49_16]OGJ97964.1 MAG: flagellar biosynthesis protein FlhB [Candidatus Raymondbacteria bacterium RIFOXYC2_FULL_50_21]OGJ98619.1 MAG: flagellar biosynthesis protein FlhB [Candidatus Raymondbacteria bacterium RifOxyC12_full_50_8]OGK01988.1 MAG: flagellar biosynthesis protein FlhB [Candidatus Ra